MITNQKATNQIAKITKDVFGQFAPSLSDETYATLAEVIYVISALYLREDTIAGKPKEPQLISPLPCFWNKENLIEAHDRFQKCLNTQVDCEGFINGFAWALTLFQGE